MNACTDFHGICFCTQSTKAQITSLEKAISTNIQPHFTNECPREYYYSEHGKQVGTKYFSFLDTNGTINWISKPFNQLPEPSLTYTPRAIQTCHMSFIHLTDCIQISMCKFYQRLYYEHRYTNSISRSFSLAYVRKVRRESRFIF